MVASFLKPPLFLLQSLYIVSLLLLYQEQISISLQYHIFFFSLRPLFFLLLLFHFFCLSGMLAQPSSVGGGPHIPPSRSAGGKGGRVCASVCVFCKPDDPPPHTHTHTHTHLTHLAHPPPQRILSEASCSPVRRVSHNTPHCKNIYAP